LRSDIEIAQQADMRPIAEVAEEAGILEEELELYGRYKAKVSLGLLGRLDEQPRGRYVVVTAVTPTPLGEGKTVTTGRLSVGAGFMYALCGATMTMPGLPARPARGGHRRRRGRKGGRPVVSAMIIDASHAKPGAMVIDVGIDHTDDGLVEPMTRAMLLANTVEAAARQTGA
jgi:hypothetical protein